MKIKICGLFRNQDIDYVNAYQPDYIGFVFAKSKRQVTYQLAKQLKQQLDPNILAVGVFVDSNLDIIEKLADDKIIDLVQLHGNEDVAYIRQLKKRIQLPIIKAIKMSNNIDLKKLNYPVDYYLLDNVVSGSGQTFNWSLIKEIDKPFFLAGGLNLNNLDQALKIKAYGLDLSSGVETDGCKDRNKIEQVVRRVKNGNR
ncbi:phosphoribosylanthranilate isomerase [uncultured Thomasclavelia sp.]|uniref:phosphoribosylanthranilate isomerase n=1 Tax=uncultured Thomasclavelia sp. TaxID=3025759 RepID=UPI0025F88F39|nr:phosphoribosylanthranilate isomerase [uncultured Thomasclavelia sp.]